MLRLCLMHIQRFDGNEATRRLRDSSVANALEDCKLEWLSWVKIFHKKSINLKIFEKLLLSGILMLWSGGNKPEYSIMSFDASLQIISRLVEQEFSTANTQVSPTSTQVSTVSIANLSDDTVYAFLASQPNGSQLVYDDLEQIHEDDREEMDLKWQLALLSMRTRRFFQKTSRKITLNGSDTFGYDTSKVECFNCHKMGHFAKGISVAPLVEELVSDDKLEKKTISPTVAKIEFVRPKKQEKPIRKPVKYAEMYSLTHVRHLTVITIKGKVVSGNNYTRVNYNYSTKKAHPSAHRNMAPRAVLMKTGLRPLNIARPWLWLKDMTGNMSYLLDFKEFDGGYVTFRGGAKGGKITSKGTLKTMCDKKNSVLFTDTGCFVLSPDFKLADESQVLLKVPRKNNMYSVDMKNIVPKESLTCLVAKATLDESMLWHRRLGHVNFKTINKLVKDNLVKGLPIKRFENDQTCVACLKGKQHKASCKSKIQNSITQPLFMLHMDLFGPTFVSSLMNKKYCLVVTDDYSRFTWVFFLASKDETSGILKSFITQIENLVDKKVKIIRCDNGTEFKNRVMSEFCEKKGIKREFSVARTPQQNGVAERRNRTLIEAARTMVLVVKPHNKTPYEIFRGRTPSLRFIKPFGCHVTILNTLDHLGKFVGKSDDGFFVGYSLNSKDFRIYNIRTRKVEENLHVRFLKDKPIIAGDGPKWLFDINVLTKLMNYVPVVAGTNSNDFVGTKESNGAGPSSKESGSSQDYILMPPWKDGLLFDSSSKDASNNEPQPSNDAEKRMMKVESMIKKGLKTVLKMLILLGQVLILPVQIFNTSSLNINTVSLTVPIALLESTYADFFGDESELDLSNIATTYLVPSTLNTRIHKDHSLDHVIGDMHSGVQTRRMINEQGFIRRTQEGNPSIKRSKLDRSYARRASAIQITTSLDIGGFTLWQEGHWNQIDYDEVFAPVARIEAIRLFLAYASFKDFVVYQMDVKSAFLYGKIEEEVYVCQPSGFEDPEFPNKVYKVEKALYGLHQAPRAWYETLSTYLFDNGFQRGQIDTTLFIKRIKSDIVQVYVDDIIFGSTRKEMCTQFEKMMHKRFQMSSMGELTFFLGLQVTQKNDGIFISQDKYVEEILKKFGFSTVKTASTPMETSKPLLKDAEAEDVDVHLYRSMIGSLMYLTASRPDIMFVVCACARFQVTPKDSPFDLEAYTDSDYAGAIANSTTEAEYVAAASCCGQVLWIQNQMLDYGYNFMNTKIFIDNESTICIVKNPVFHSKTKHIKIRHHFIRDSNEKKLIQMIKIHTNQNVADLLTKAFDVGRFQYLIASIGMLNL
ncbi:putative ribonuclease H-like domain-containing protein [Tanacetum coccineum]